MKRCAVILIIAAICVAAPAGAAHWTVDYKKSRVGFTVNWSKEPFSASFNRWNADIDFDPADLAHASASVTIDLASETSDEPDFDSGLKGAQGFETSHYPTARFATKGFTRKSDSAYVATGALTIRNISHEIALPFTLSISGQTAHMTGAAHVVRTDFGVGQGDWASSTPVSHDVTVSIDLTATR